MSFEDFSFGSAKVGKVGAEEYDSTSDSDSDDDNDGYQRPQTDPASNEFGDFNPRKRRRTGRDAKESAALGIFGSESEDEDTRPGGRRWKRKPLRKQGMSFVSSGAKQKTSDDEDEDDDDEEDDDEYGKFTAPEMTGVGASEEDEDDEDEDEDAMKGIGLGFGSSSRGQGLGFAPASKGLGFVSASQPPRQPSSTTDTTFGPHAPADFDPQNPLGRGFVPSSAYEPVLNETAMKQPDKPTVIARPSAFSSKMQGGGRGGRGSDDKPKFNANSFGARMMAKMGYVAGQGLGKEAQGRNIIIEANLRPQGAGLGAVKEKSEKERKEEKRQARLRGEAVLDSDEEEKQAKAAAAAARKKKKQAGVFGSGAPSSATSTPRRAKAKYMTMDEVKKAAPGLNIPEAFTPILDMTGPGRKLLTSSSGLMTPTSGTPNSGAAEETAEQAESRKLARRAQNDFMAILEEWQSLQNRKAYAELQAQQEKQELAELEANLQGHKVMTDAFSQLAVLDGLASWQQKWTATVAKLKAAADTIPEASLADMKDELASISVAAIHPLFKQALESWEPLQHPNKELAEDLLSMRNLLGIDAPLQQQQQQTRRRSSATPYETMVYKLWLPHVSKAVRQWNVHDTDSLLSLYETWLPLLPDFVRIQLLEQDIVRKLDDAVAKWEPKRRRHQNQSQRLPHLWLFPWLPYLPSRHLDPKSADGLVAEVKRKFRQLVDVWEFYRGVVPGLQRWRDMLRPRADNDQWRPLVMSHVLPSMARYVRAQFRVDVADQAPYLEVITGEFQWLEEELMAAELVGEVMVAEVFPMWHETLYHLLTTPGLASLDQIAQWLQWWTDEVFPPAIQRLPSVTAEFERGLAMVNEALDLGGEPELVQASLAPPAKGPALKTAEKLSLSSRDDRRHHHRHSSHHHHSNGHHHRRDESVTAGPAGAPEESEEMSIRHYVEEWCENNDLQFIPERKKVHAQGPLYRITARGDGKGGVLAYFKGLRLYADTKKGAVEIRVDRDEDWAKLLAMAQ